MDPTAVSEIEQSDHTHVREAAARLLAGRLGIGFLVFISIHELDRAAVDSLEIEPVPAVAPGHPRIHVSADPVVDVLEE